MNACVVAQYGKKIRTQVVLRQSLAHSLAPLNRSITRSAELVGNVALDVAEVGCSVSLSHGLAAAEVV